MKKYSFIAILTFVTLFLSSCEVIGGIFKAGMWSGIIIVALVLAIIIWLISKFMGRKGE